MLPTPRTMIAPVLFETRTLPRTFRVRRSVLTETRTAPAGESRVPRNGGVPFCRSVLRVACS